MLIHTETKLQDFEFWCGAVDTVKEWKHSQEMN